MATQITYHNGQTYVENLDESHTLWQQWIERHNPPVETVSHKMLTSDEATFGQPTEFDEALDYDDRIAARKPVTVRRHLCPSPTAAGEAMAIHQVILGYRTRSAEQAIERLERQGYADIPALYRDHEPPTYEELERMGID